MKKAIISVALLAAGLLSGCSSEEGVSRPETIGQTGILTFSFPAPRQSITYAIGDATEPETAVPATAGEIEINDVTVYMFKNSGVPDEETLVARKTASPDEVGARSVTFDVDDFTVGGENYLFYAVANVQGNFTDNFVVGSTTLNDFTTAVTTDTGAEPIPGSHMLMTGYVAIANLSTQTDPVQTINLRHRVARFDIDNLADDGNPSNNNPDTDGDGGGNADETFFEITKIHVYGTRSRGYLAAEKNSQTRPDIADTVSLKIDVSKISGINEVPVAGAFYLWPGKLADKTRYTDYKEDGTTVIEVEGIYTGDGKTELFTVLLDSEKDIEANKRYTLKVKRISQTTLTFNLVASDWGDDGEAMTAAPTTNGSFVYGGFELLAGGEDESVPVENNTVDMSANTGDSDNELRFYTESDSKATGALTASLGGMTFGAGYASNVITPVPDGDPVVSTYSIGKVRQYYKITLPKTTYPISGTLTIKDEKTQREKELDITSVPVYEDTDYEPVQVEGQYSEGGPANKRRYWAPVNVGATSTTYNAASPFETCGYTYQWGRNVPFVYDSTNTADDKQPGPVTAEEASDDYATKFITTGGGDWLDVSNNDLWSGENAQGPCPNGWRVPTEAELIVLKSKISSAVLNNRVSVAGVGATLYLPTAGIRNISGSWDGRTTWGSYWSSTISDIDAWRLAFSNSTSNMYTAHRAYGSSVRCIQK
ncbi:MAG: FimB/Mfa2 family fimbrial subunit [Prevotella sp.]|jgi:hypothetical protein|nr:FimB/Mfa2 family fimbrial subunit [Prevotella sp.]